MVNFFNDVFLFKMPKNQKLANPKVRVYPSKGI